LDIKKNKKELEETAQGSGTTLHLALFSTQSRPELENKYTPAPGR